MATRPMPTPANFGKFSVAALLGIGEQMRSQNPKLQRTTGRSPRWFIRPYIEKMTEAGVISKQERIFLGICSEMSERKATVEKNRVMEKINRRQWVVASQIPFGAFIDKWMETYVQAESNLSSATRIRYERLVEFRIRPAFGSLRMGEITTQRIDEWLAGMAKEGLAYTTRNGLRNTLSGIFTKARKWGLWKEANPAMDATVGKAREAREKRKLANEQLRALLDGLPGPLVMICKLALLTLRISEALALQEKHLEFYAGVGVGSVNGDTHRESASRSDDALIRAVGSAALSQSHKDTSAIDQRHRETMAGSNPARQLPISGTIHIRQRYYLGNIDTCKTSKSVRDIPMGILAAELKAMCIGDPERYLFAGWTYERAQAKIRTRAKALKFYWEGFGWHSFRRMSQGGIAATGLEPNQVMKLMGHGSTALSLLYSLNDAEAQRKAIEEFQAGMFEGKVN